MEPISCPISFMQTQIELTLDGEVFSTFGKGLPLDISSFFSVDAKSREPQMHSLYQHINSLSLRSSYTGEVTADTSVTWIQHILYFPAHCVIFYSFTEQIHFHLIKCNTPYRLKEKTNLSPFWCVKWYVIHRQLFNSQRNLPHVVHLLTISLIID